MAGQTQDANETNTVSGLTHVDLHALRLELGPEGCVHVVGAGH